MLENLKNQVASLEADIRELEEKIRAKTAEKTTAAARMQAQIFLERIFAPYMEGLCEGWGMSPEEGLRLLIKEGTTLDKIANENREALAEFVNQPEVRVIAAVARPLGNVSDEWIKDKASVLLDVMGKIRPSMADIMTTPEGQEWFHESLTGLRAIMFGRQKANYQPKSSAPRSTTA